MAEYELSFDDDQKLVRGTVCGNLSKAQGLKLVAEARILAAKKGYGILWDVRHATLQVQLADFFFLPRELEKIQEPSARRIKVALLVPQSAMEDYHFYENVAANVGLNVKVFVDENEAVTWLS